MKIFFHLSFSLFILSFVSLASMAQVFQPNTGTQRLKHPIPNSNSINTNTLQTPYIPFQVHSTVRGENCTDGIRERNGSFEATIDGEKGTLCIAYKYEISSPNGFFKKGTTSNASIKINGLAAGDYQVSIKGCNNNEYTDKFTVLLRQRGRIRCR